MPGLWANQPETSEGKYPIVLRRDGTVLTSRLMDADIRKYLERIAKLGDDPDGLDDIGSLMGELVGGADYLLKRVFVDAASCSFCGKPSREVRHLVAAATGARICDECLAGAREVEPGSIPDVRRMVDELFELRDGDVDLVLAEHGWTVAP